MNYLWRKENGEPSARRRAVTEEQLTQKICDEVEKAGSLRSLGKRWGVSAMFLCDLRKGRRKAGPRILKILGLKREITIISTISKAAGKEMK